MTCPFLAPKATVRPNLTLQAPYSPHGFGGPVPRLRTPRLGARHAGTPGVSGPAEAPAREWRPPGFWESLAGLAVAPVRCLRWVFQDSGRAFAFLLLALFASAVATPFLNAQPDRHRDARRLLEHAAQDVRNAEKPPQMLNLPTSRMRGDYYTLDRRVHITPEGEYRLTAYCHTTNGPWVEYRFDKAGHGSFTWYECSSD